jgi:hypothetical protein
MITDPVRSSYSEHIATSTRQYFLMAGGKFLNQSGQFMQDGRRYAWKGTIEQARNCRSQFVAAASCRVVAVKATEPVRLAEGA